MEDADNIQLFPETLTLEEAKGISIQAGKVFTPRTPVSVHELFAGRWDQLTTVADSVLQTGLHVLIYGERGVGKTSLANVLKPVLHIFDKSDSTQQITERLVVKVNANTTDTFSSLFKKAFGEISWVDNEPKIGFAPSVNVVTQNLIETFKLPAFLTIDDVRRVLMQLPGSVFIFDEFDRVAKEETSSFTDLIKVLTDYSVPGTVILVGVSDTVGGLIEDHGSIGRALIQIQLPRMTEKELEDILDKGEKNLSIKFEKIAKKRIVHLSQGLPHYTHLVGLHSVRIACDKLSREISVENVNDGFLKAVNQAEQSVRDQYSTATLSAHKEALYEPVLLACAIVASKTGDSSGYFQASSVTAPLSKILDRSVEISTFNRHINEFCENKRGPVFERSGQPRGYRFRFRNPLLVPYVYMKSFAKNIISNDLLEELTGIEA